MLENKNFRLPLYITEYIFFNRCLRVAGALGKGETREIVCTKPEFGQYVFVTLKGKDWLTLCEVEVFAIASKPSLSRYCNFLGANNHLFLLFPFSFFATDLLLSRYHHYHAGSCFDFPLTLTIAIFFPKLPTSVYISSFIHCTTVDKYLAIFFMIYNYCL